MHRGLKWLGAISLLLAAVSQWWPTADHLPVTPVSTAAGGSRPRPVAALPPLASAPAVDLFAPPASAAPTVEAPIRPVRREVPDPPLPFEIGGTWQRREASAAAADGLVVFLQSAGKTVAVCQGCLDPEVSHPGAILAGGYRLEQVTAGKIEFTRLSDDKRKFLEWMP